MNNDQMIYFAYGANLSKTDMARRCPGCIPLQRALLPDHRLVFRGVADIVPAEGETVQGAFYRITPEHLDALDDFEGMPYLYIRKEMTVLLEDGNEAKAILYQMTNRKTFSRPGLSYLVMIIEGCRSWGIAEEYIDKIRKAASPTQKEDKS